MTYAIALPKIHSDEVEGTFGNNEYAHFICANDGDEGDFAHHIDLRFTDDEGALCYTNSYANDGVGHVYADCAQRTPEFKALLLSFEGNYCIKFLICFEECRIGRWFELEDAYFDSARDREDFRAFIDSTAATVKNATEVVKQTRYSRQEAAQAHKEVEALVVAGSMSMRSGAAYKAHISRRVVANEMRDREDKRGVDDVLNGRRDDSVLVRSVVAALERKVS